MGDELKMAIAFFGALFVGLSGPPHVAFMLDRVRDVPTPARVVFALGCALLALAVAS